MKILFKRSILVFGEHRERGTIHDINPATTAKMLIQSGDAVTVADAAETAEEPHSEKETATLPRPEKGRKSKQ
jgi:hypothetical protein